MDKTKKPHSDKMVAVKTLVVDITVSFQYCPYLKISEEKKQKKTNKQTTFMLCRKIFFYSSNH